jgi:hypothetical protein
LALLSWQQRCAKCPFAPEQAEGMTNAFGEAFEERMPAKNGISVSAGQADDMPAG